ncbi:MAG: helix-turn-helix domain-containing protein [Dehalococcoidia bacterium]
MAERRREGWSISRIAGYLQCRRPTSYRTLRRWRDEDFAGLPDKPQSGRRRALKTDLQAIDAARKLQMYGSLPVQWPLQGLE